MFSMRLRRPIRGASLFLAVASISIPGSGVAAIDRPPVVAAPELASSAAAHVLDVTAGGLHTCVIRADGTLGCWGDDYSGQSTPPNGTFIAIDAGPDSTCGIRTDGSIACWGGAFETNGALPTGTFKDVSVGSYHACAIRSDDTVACWGNAEHGQSTPPDGTFLAVSPGTWHTCGIRTDNSLVCWGGLPEEEIAPVPTGDPVSALDGVCVIRAAGDLVCWSVFAGEWLSPLTGSFQALGGSCAIGTDLTLACWGEDDGTGLTSPPAGTFKAVSASESHACAIRVDDTLACWGGDWMGQRTPRPTPSVAVDPWRTDSSAPVGWSARYALVPVASYDVRFRRARWDTGFGTWTTLLSGTTTTSATFQTTPGYTYCYSVRARDLEGVLSPWSNQVSNAAHSGCTATPLDDRSLTRSAGWTAATGAAFYRGTSLRSAQTGARLSVPVTAVWIAIVATTCPSCGSVRVSLGREMSRRVSLTSPTRMHQRVIPVFGTRDSTDASSGTFRIEVISTGSPVIIDGVLATRLETAPAWADWEDPPTPAVGASSRAVDLVSGGDDHTCARKPDDTIACWGSNSHLQSSAPAGTFTDVSAGAETTCAIRSDGAVACWGGDSPWSYEPPPAVPVGAYSAISVGEWRTCGIRDDGAAVCWGDGDLVRDGPFTDVSVGWVGACAIRSIGTIACWDGYGGPIDAPEGTYTAVNAGPAHVCAIRKNGTLACWGSDTSGQATPPEGGFTAVAAGEAFTCGLRIDGTIACWGDDHYGQTSSPAGTFTALDAGRRHACAISTAGGLTCWGQNHSGQVTPTPTATLGAIAGVVVDSRASVSWSANSLAPIQVYDVRSRQARFGSTLGSWTTWRTGTPSVTGSKSLAPGSWTCFQVRAIDEDGLRSAWSNERCTTTPFDDRAFGRSTGWREVSSPSYYRGTALRSSSYGGRLTLGRVPAWAGISLVVTTCPTCGRVRVSWGQWGLRTVSLYSTTTVHRQVIRITRFDDEAPGETAVVTIRVVSSGKKVQVDGLLLVGPDPLQ